jgi:hypothetical protein
VEKTGADGSYFVDGGVEGGFVGFGGLVEAADLPDELQRGVANLRVGHGGVEVEEVFDVSAHGGNYRQSGYRLAGANDKSRYRFDFAEGFRGG